MAFFHIEWLMEGTSEVEADTEEEAIERFQEDRDYYTRNEVEIFRFEIDNVQEYKG